MNRIYQGKVTQVEIPDPGILSASNDAPRSRERERVVEDRVRDVGEKHESAERTEVRCRNQSWLLFHRDTDEARRLTGRIPELRQQVEAEIKERAGWSVEEQKRRPKSAELLEYEKLRAEQRQQWQDALWQHHQLFLGAVNF
jgi:hypothetical protein